MHRRVLDPEGKDPQLSKLEKENRNNYAIMLLLCCSLFLLLNIAFVRYFRLSTLLPLDKEVYYSTSLTTVQITLKAGTNTGTSQYSPVADPHLQIRGGGGGLVIQTLRYKCGVQPPKKIFSPLGLILV